MNYSLGFDMGAALLLTALGARGFYRGFFGEILSLASLASGIFCAWRYSGFVSEFISNYFPSLDGAVANVIAGSIIFFAITLAFGVVSKIARAFVKFAELSFFNHVAGLLLGVTTGLCILLLVYTILTMLAPHLGAGWAENSIFMDLMSKIWAQGWFDTSKIIPQM